MTSVLLSAVTSGRYRQARLLLESGSSVHQADECGQTPLILAVFLQHARTREKLTRVLLKHHAKVSQCDVVGRNALSWACLYGQSKEVALMLRSADVDLDLNKQDHEGQTALFHAATSGNAATVRLMVEALKKYSLTVDVPNVHGLTALMQAIKLRHDVCASILRHQGGAIAGAQMTSPDEVQDVTKWAVTSHITPRKPGTDGQTAPAPAGLHGSFPPILSPAISRRIKVQESRAQLLAACPALDSDDELLFGSEMSYCSSSTLDDLLQDKFDNASSLCSNDSRGIRLMSYNSSTEAVVDSSSEDELVNDETCLLFTAGGGGAGGMSRSFVASRDLEQMFRIYEDQKSPSYRPTAARPRPASIKKNAKPAPLDITNVESTPKAKDKGSKKSRAVVSKKQQKRLVLDPVEPTRFPSQLRASLNDLTSQKLPRIPSEGISQSADNSPNVARMSTQKDWFRNYSLI